MWYFEYIVKVWEKVDDNSFLITRSGLVTGDCLTDAVKELESYYYDELEEIRMLKAITDGVFEFESVKEDHYNFDFIINRKCDLKAE